MKIYEELDEELDVDDDELEVEKGEQREAKAEKAVKFQVTDTDGETWMEYLTRDEVRAYHNQGYKLSQVYFWQFWR